MHNEHPASFVLDTIPESLQGRIILDEGTLYWSSELQGNMQLDALVARLRRRGISRLESKRPEEFNRYYAQVYSGSVPKTDSEVERKAVDLIHKAYASGASDIHITHYGSYAHVSFRVLGMLEDYTQLPGDVGERMIQGIYQTMSLSGDATFVNSERQDARITDRNYLPQGVHSIRLHTEPIQTTFSADGTGSYMAMRLLYDATKATGSLEERLHTLGFTEAQQATFRALTQRSGLNIISGPTGHGKTTVLKQGMESMAYSMPEKNYMSLEDPPEFPLQGVKQILLGSKTLTEDEREARYAAAIAGLMRSDPDVLMIGEIRFRSAAQAAIEAALTGHGIWATVHASNALAIISRFAEMGISLNSLCNQNVLSGLSYQRLIPLLCPKCSELLADNEDAIPKDTVERLYKVGLTGIQGVRVRGRGCDECKGKGLIGQTVAAEVIDVDHTLLSFLRRDDLLGARDYWINGRDGVTHVGHALQLIAAGRIDPLLAEIRLGVTLDHDQTFMSLKSTI